MMKEGLGDKIVFSTAYKWWGIEAALKKRLSREYGIEDSLVEIISGATLERTTSYIEAIGLSKIVDPDDEIVVVGQEYHAERAADALRYLFEKVDVVKVPTSMERILDPSWLKSVLCSSSMLSFILYNWFLNIITPYMMRREIRKQKGG